MRELKAELGLLTKNEPANSDPDTSSTHRALEQKHGGNQIRTGTAKKNRTETEQQSTPRGTKRESESTMNPGVRTNSGRLQHPRRTKAEKQEPSGPVGTGFRWQSWPDQETGLNWRGKKSLSRKSKSGQQARRGEPKRMVSAAKPRTSGSGDAEMEAGWCACRGTKLPEEWVYLRAGPSERRAEPENPRRENQTAESIFHHGRQPGNDSLNRNKNSNTRAETANDFKSGCGHSDPAKTKRKKRNAQTQNKNISIEI
jgi:hypothetical protein